MSTVSAAAVRKGSPSTEGPPLKRSKGSSSFIPRALSSETAHSRRNEYRTSQPYKHAVADSIFEDSLLRRVVDEVAMKEGDAEAGLGGLVGWGAKETDIYKINQSFDLSSLTPEHLPETTLAKLPALQELRDALYSEEFRHWVREVTECGPLSQQKVDGSVSRYTKGCHLLLHDDVISTRRISWILYLPSEAWTANWGGALELYSSLQPHGVPSVAPSPEGTTPSWREEIGSDVFPGKVIHPKWGQFVFFEVQPGMSYHSVEEVVMGEGKERLSISGWFHKPIEGELGHEPEKEGGDKSSLEQITQQSLSSALTPYPEEALPNMPGTPLTAEEVTFLAPYFHPQYLQSKTLAVLSQQFAEASVLMLEKFLHADLASALETALSVKDTSDGLDFSSRSAPGAKKIPNMRVGHDIDGWEVIGPSTRQRYLALDPASPAPAADSPTATIHKLLTEVLPSDAFRSWLGLITSYIPIAHKLEARRFRPGLDYTLARGEDEEARLDVRIGLTPGVKWEEIEGGESLGAWEAYLAPPDEDDDPAVYKASKPTTAKPAGADDEADSEEDDEDGPLLTSQPSFNTLLIVMRDAKVMKFTKYISAEAPCSRWDLGGEWEVGAMAEEDGEDDDEAGDA